MSIKGLEIHIKKKKPMPSQVLETYWRFAAERQEIFFKRFHNQSKPWTLDPILNKYRFTNAYRASDRVSQYLIQNIIYKSPASFEETFFKVLLFKTFNKISTWQLLHDHIEEINVKSFSFKKYSSVLKTAIQTGKTMYSGAYIMASGKSYFGFARKFENHLKLIELMLKDNLPQKILDAKSLETIFNLLKEYPTIGNFLAYQYTIDLNYCQELKHSEMDFVMPGPGAKDGIKKCFRSNGDYTEAEIIHHVTDLQGNEYLNLGINFKNLFGRPLQLIDCQNLFCEVDKYSRVHHPNITGFSKRKRIKQLFMNNESNFTHWYPPKWGLNSKIELTNGKRKECFYQSF